MWRYSLRWNKPHIFNAGRHELLVVDVPEGHGIPAEVIELFVPGGDYSICLDFLRVEQIKRWSPERKAAVRQKNLERRVMKHAPLFADEIIGRELAARSDYYKGNKMY